MRRDEVVAEATHCVTCGQPFTVDNPATGGHTETPLRAIPRQDRRASASTARVEAECSRCNYGWSR